jgi:hypothetical protein
MRQAPMPAAGIAGIDITTRELAAVAGARTFFGHQSVGNDLLRAVPGVYAAHGMVAPPIVGVGVGVGVADVVGDGGFLAHAAIGANGQPLLKIKEFAARLRGGIAARVDVAMMKLCYIDIAADTDVAGLFSTYRDTLAGLAREYPDVRVVAVTVPVTTDADVTQRLKAGIKTVLGRADRFGRAENVARQRLNALIRREYADDALFDLAAVESTGADGTRAGGRHRGQEYLALCREYAADCGHLNQRGADTAATAWLAAIARAVLRSP